MVLKLGINEWPMPGRIVKRATYEAECHALTKKDGEPFFHYAIWKDMFFAGFIVLAVAACAFILVLLDPPGSLIRQSSKLRPSRITFSCGSMRCFHFFRHRLRRRFFLSSRL
jgi:hypothetical protein